MICQHVQLLLVEWAEGLLSPELAADVETHLLECPDCRAEADVVESLHGRLSADGEWARAECGAQSRGDIAERVVSRLRHPVISASSQQGTSSSPYLRLIFGLTSVAAAAIVLLALMLLPSARVASAAEILGDGLKALAGLTSVHIKAELRAPPGGDNLVTVDLAGQMVPIEMYKRFGDHPAWRIEAPNRVLASDSQQTLLYIKPLKLAARWPGDRSTWFNEVMDLDHVLAGELQSAQHPGTRMTSAEETVGGQKHRIVTIETKAHGDFTHDWLKDKSFSASDTRRVYTFDAASKRLRQLQVFVHAPDNKDILAFQTTAIEYNVATPETLFTIELPKDVQWYAQPTTAPAGSPATQPSAEGFARAFFEHLARQDAAGLKQDLGYVPGGIEGFRELRVVSIGTAFKSGLYPGTFVPYTIELASGERKTMFLAIRNDNAGKRWEVDGGW